MVSGRLLFARRRSGLADRLDQQGEGRQDEDGQQGGGYHRAGGQFFVVVVLDRKHRGDGGAGAGPAREKAVLYTTFPAPQRSEKICVFPVDKRCFLRYNNQVGSALPATYKNMARWSSG